MKNQLNTHYSCVYNIRFDLVFVTKDRKNCINSDMLNRLKVIVFELCEKWGVVLVRFKGESDYVHLYLDFHPNLLPSKFINNLKTVTSRLIRKEYGIELSVFYDKPVLWARGYCLLTDSSRNQQIISDYIERQKPSS